MRWLLVLLLMSAAAWGDVLEQADGLKLHYYFDPPAVRGPLVVILQGSECLRVSDKYGPFIQRFVAAGVGVLRVEKPGLGPDTPVGSCPVEYLQRNTLERRLWDLLSVLGEMRKNPLWDGRLVLLGGSEGAMLAGLAAPLVPETRGVVILSGGGGITFAEEITEMMRSLGAGEAQLAEFAALCSAVHREPTTLKEWGSDGKLARNTHLWLSRAEDLAIWRPLLRVDAPILVVHGGKDESTPVRSAERLHEVFKTAGKTNLELRIEDEDGHSPSAGSLERTMEWVLARLR